MKVHHETGDKVVYNASDVASGVHEQSGVVHVCYLFHNVYFLMLETSSTSSF